MTVNCKEIFGFMIIRVQENDLRLKYNIYLLYVYEPFFICAVGCM
jgi:hypothetical protein